MNARTAAALPAVLFVIALTSALIVGGAYASRTLVTGTRLARLASELQSPAERVLVDLVAAWDTAGRGAMALGEVTVESPMLQDGVPVYAWVIRVSDQTWWMVAEATSLTPDRIQRRLGLLVRSEQGRIRPVPGPAWTQLP